MKPRKRIGGWKFGSTLSARILMLAGVWISVLPAVSGFAQTAVGQGGVISGKVTADPGVVRTFRVHARDTVRKITYIVFTNKGSYQIFNLPPGSYDVYAMAEGQYLARQWWRPQEGGYESPIQHIELKAGEESTANLAAKERPTKPSNVELVDFDTFFPPGPGRDILLDRCGACHLWRSFRPRSEQEWRRAVGRMFDTKWGDVQVPSDAVSATDRETIINYLATNLGENSKRRDLKLDQLTVDEDELTRALYVQYEMPPAVPSPPDGKIRERRVDQTLPSRVSPTIWMGERSGAILAMDRNNLDYPGRYREWQIPQTNPDSDEYRRRSPRHGLAELGGHIYWTETLDPPLKGSAVVELDPETGQMTRYPSPTGGSLHSSAADSDGNFWYTSWFGPSLVGRFNTKTKKFTEWDPAPDHKFGGYYGLTFDKKGRTWVCGVSTNIIVSFDPKTEKWTSYFPPKQLIGGSNTGAVGAAPRRPAVDSKGKIWFTMTTGNALGVLDPDTGKFKVYIMPMRYSAPYDVNVDTEDNIWVDTWEYGVFSRFDQKTEKFTIFPRAEVGDHDAKSTMDAQGNFWSDSGVPKQLSSFNPKGNVPIRAPHRPEADR